MVGAPWLNCCNPTPGAAYVWRRTGSLWSYDGVIHPSHGEDSNGFGGAVATWNGRIAVKAGKHAHDGPPNAGAVFVY